MSHTQCSMVDSSEQESHPAGDELLRCAHDVLRRLTRSEDARRQSDSELAVSKSNLDEQIDTVSRLREELAAAKTELNAASESLLEERSKRVKVDEDLSRMRTELRQKDASIAQGNVDLQKELLCRQDCEAQLVAQSLKNADLQERLENAQALLRSQVEENSVLESSMSNRQRRITTLEDEIEASKRDLAREHSNCRAMAQQVEGKNAELLLSFAQNETALATIEGMKKASRETGERIDRALQEIQELSSQLSAARVRISELSTSNEEMMGAKKQAESARAQLEQESSALVLKMQESKARMLALDSDLQCVRESYHHLCSALAQDTCVLEQDTTTADANLALWGSEYLQTPDPEAEEARSKVACESRAALQNAGALSGPLQDWSIQSWKRLWNQDASIAALETAPGSGASVKAQCEVGEGKADLTRQQVDEMLMRRCKRVQQLRADLCQARDALRSEEALRDVAQGDLRDARAHIDRLKEQVQRLEVSVKLRDAESEQARGQKHALAQELQLCKEQLEQSEAEREAACVRDRQQIQGLRDEMRKEVARLQEELDAVMNMLAEARGEVTEVQRLAEEVCMHRDQQKGQLKETQEALHQSSCATQLLRRELEASAALCSELTVANGLLLSAIDANVDLQHGVGVLLQHDVKSPHMVVKSVLPGSPAARSLDVGTYITHIDSVPLAGLSVDQAHSLLLGPEHAPVMLQCLPATYASSVPVECGEEDSIESGNARNNKAPFFQVPDFHAPFLKSGDLNSIFIDTTSAARNMLSSSLLMPKSMPLSARRSSSIRSGEGDQQIFRVALLRRNNDPGATRDCPLVETECAAQAEGDRISKITTSRAVEAYCRLSGSKGDIQALAECVEMLVATLDLSMCSADDAYRKIVDEWTLFVEQEGGLHLRGCLQLLSTALGEQFEEEEPTATGAAIPTVSAITPASSDLTTKLDATISSSDRGVIGTGGDDGKGKGNALQHLVATAKKTAQGQQNKFDHKIGHLVECFTRVLSQHEDTHTRLGQTMVELRQVSERLEKAESDVHALTSELAKEHEVCKVQNRDLVLIREQADALDRNLQKARADLKKTEASAAEMKAKAMKASDGERNAVQEVHKLSDKLSRLQMKFTNAEHNLSVATKQKETQIATLKTESAELLRKHKELESAAESRARGWNTCKDSLNHMKGKMMGVEVENGRLKKEVQRQREILEDQLREIHTLRLSPVGIGIHIADRTFEVKKLVEGASAHCSGQIRVGDFLKAVDGKDVDGESIKTVRHLLQGAPGTWVSLELKRLINSSAATSRGAGRGDVKEADGKKDALLAVGEEDVDKRDILVPDFLQEVLDNSIDLETEQSLHHEVYEVMLVRGLRLNTKPGAGSSPFAAAAAAPCPVETISASWV